MTSLEGLIAEFEKNIHEVKMYIHYERNTLENYNLKYDIIELNRLFHEFENYNTVTLDKLIALRKKIEQVLSLILTQKSVDIVFPDSGINFYDDPGIHYKPLFDTIDKKIKPQNDDITKFLNEPEFTKVITQFSSNYRELRGIIEKAMLDKGLQNENNNSASQGDANKEYEPNPQPVKGRQISAKIANTQTPEYITRKEAAEILGISLVTLNKWTKNGFLNQYNVLSKVRYIKAEVYELFKKQER